MMAEQRFRAKRLLGLASVTQAHPGALLFLQRFDSALRLTPHAHALCLDGVYVEDGEGLGFAALPEPNDRIRVPFKQGWSDGTASILLSPQDLVARLAALVPPPKFHLLRPQDRTGREEASASCRLIITCEPHHSFGEFDSGG